MDKLNLPFKVGEQIESRSFDQGYRGAWFRCTIRGLKKVKGSLHYELEYYDFPDEELHLEKIYQKPSTSRSKKQLMIRPPFPPIHLESQIPNLSTISDVIVVVDGVWKVGDLVDWFTTGCYWCGSVTEILGKEMVQIDLLPPPAGEGSSYEVSCKDLRPSLDWSLERGWMVPHPKDKENHRRCARLIKPMNDSDIGRTDTQATARDNVSSSSPTSAGSSPSQAKSEQTLKRPRSITDSIKKDNADKNKDLEETSCFDSVPVAKRTRRITKSKEKDESLNVEDGVGKTSTESKEKDKSLDVDDGVGKTSTESKEKDESLDVDDGFGKTSTESKEKDRSMDVEDRVVGETSCSDSDSSSCEMVGAVAETEQHNGESSKETEVNKVVAEVEQCSDVSLTIALNSMYRDSLEAAFMDLEELANRVKWLKGILKPTLQRRPGWKFIEHRAR